jgi:hypothetical protein
MLTKLIQNLKNKILFQNQTKRDVFNQCSLFPSEAKTVGLNNLQMLRYEKENLEFNGNVIRVGRT